MSNWRGKSLWSVSGRFGAAGLAFLLNVILARALSQDDLGQFFLSLSIAWGGALLCQWGSSILAVKWVAQARARGDHAAVRSAVWSLIFFTVLQGLVIGAILMLWNRPLETKAIWAGWLFAVGLQSLLPEILRGFDDLKWASLLLGPVPQFLGVAFVGVGWFGVNQLSFYQASTLMIISNLSCSALGLMLIARRAAPSLKLLPYREFVRESTPIALSLAATYLLSQADLWVCGSMLSKEQVAIYGIAQRFVVFVSMPMMIFGSVITPKLAELLAGGDRAQLSRLLDRGTVLTSLMAISFFLGGALVGWPIMRFLFGEKYALAHPIFLILGAGQVIHALAGPNGYVLLLSGEQRAAMFATVASAVLLAFGAWIGASILGAPGIAVGSSFALIVQTAWMWLEVRRRLKFSSHFQWRQAREQWRALRGA